MANLITEGFDWFPAGKSSTARDVLWAANGFYPCDFNSVGVTMVPDVRTGRFGFGKAMGLLSANNNPGTRSVNGYVIPFPDGDVIDEGFIGFSFWRGANTHPFHKPGAAFYDAVTNEPQLFVEFSENGVIKVWNTFPYAPGAIVLTNSKAGSFQEDSWFNVEIYGLIAVSGGIVEVRINTVPKIQLVGADTQQTAIVGFDSIFIGEQILGGFVTDPIDVAWDDLFVNDTTGATNNTWAGNLRVKTQFMIADGFTNDFTIGGTSPAATNWQSVLNQSIDDTQYVFSPNIGDVDLYTPDPILNAPYVRVVQVRKALRQDDATQRSAKAVLRIGGVNYENSVEHFTNQTFTFYKSRWELNPDTGVSFTGVEVNGLQSGIKVES